MSPTVRARLQRAVEENRAAPLELAMADWALRHGGSEPVAVAWAACTRALAEGHSCLALDSAEPAIPGEQPFCGRSALQQALEASHLVGAPGDAKPLILDHGRLYLQRYWAYEHRLVERLHALLGARPADVDHAALLPGGLFDYGWIGAGETHWQAVAAFVALRHRLTIISGGPGTGKTYTVLRLLRLLIEAAQYAGHAPPRIRLAAPTGKAAARMVDATRGGLSDMTITAAIRALIPQEAQTLHRLIGIGRGMIRPRHNPDNPLPADAVIVDEASMVDLPMMTKLVEALPAHARLILLGDRYQLASVESGSVLADLCSAAGMNAFSRAQQQAADSLLQAPMHEGRDPLADHVVTLQTSHRFRADSPIGRLAAAVNAGDAEQALAIAHHSAPQIEYQDAAKADNLNELVTSAVSHYHRLITANTPEEALHHLQQRGLLCAIRRGPAGSITLNRRITEQLALAHGLETQRAWYHGRPIIVTRNDYRARLFNGDTGVCLADADGYLRVWFLTDEGPRALLPTALPEHDTVYAMTVHKSQGSEFDHLTLVLPGEDNPVLSRELLYTGITRARETVRILAADTILRLAIQRPIERHSGLVDRL